MAPGWVGEIPARWAAESPARLALTDGTVAHTWGDLEQALYGLEAALALALEATGHAIQLWEGEDGGEERFGDEFALSAGQVDSLDDEWRLAYIARLLYTAAETYGVSPGPLTCESTRA